MSNIADTSVPVRIDDRAARRNAFILSGGQMLFGCTATITVITGGLIGLSLAQNKAPPRCPLRCI